MKIRIILFLTPVISFLFGSNYKNEISKQIEKNFEKYYEKTYHQKRLK